MLWILPCCPGPFSWMHFPSVRVPAENVLSNDLRMFTPAVKYVPEWFPGAGFKTFARTAKKNLDDSVNLPFHHVKESFEVRETLLPLLILVFC